MKKSACLTRACKRTSTDNHIEGPLTLKFIFDAILRAGKKQPGSRDRD